LRHGFFAHEGGRVYTCTIPCGAIAHGGCRWGKRRGELACLWSWRGHPLGVGPDEIAARAMLCAASPLPLQRYCCSRKKGRTAIRAPDEYCTGMANWRLAHGHPLTTHYMRPLRASYEGLLGGEERDIEVAAAAESLFPQAPNENRSRTSSGQRRGARERGAAFRCPPKKPCRRKESNPRQPAGRPRSDEFNRGACRHCLIYTSRC